MRADPTALALLALLLAAPAGDAEETLPAAPAEPVCAGFCCVIGGELVCTRPAEPAPGSLPVTTAGGPPLSLDDWRAIVDAWRARQGDG